MSSFCRLACVLALVGLSIGVSQANPTESAEQPSPSVAVPEQPFSSSWLNSVWQSPVFQFFTSFFQPSSDSLILPPPDLTLIPEAAQVLPPCAVAPLDPIEDADAEQLESRVGSENIVDVSGMMPAASHALDRFQTTVASVGGVITLKSAYRPLAYQSHLRNVWYKWMDELRDNTDPSCQDLRAQVQDEFTRHHLIETQHPVAISDHTRGLAFDATVDLPFRARLGRRRVTLDSLAHLSGLTRPAIASDPVHFKYVGLDFRVSRRHARNS